MIEFIRLSIEMRIHWLTVPALIIFFLVRMFVWESP
jgi:hypothetical protein